MSKQIKCYNCGGSHNSRDCTYEKTMKLLFKKAIGPMIENVVASNMCCPMCKKDALYVIGDNSPSHDLTCRNCERKFEVKSKALSLNKTTKSPTDIYFLHGCYDGYTNRVAQGLHLIVVIYEIDRKTKMINLREAYHASNKMLKENKSNVIQVTQRANSTLSYINIKNKLNLNEIKFTSNIKISYESMFNTYKTLLDTQSLIIDETGDDNITLE